MMKKALITLEKRLKLDSSNTYPVLKEMLTLAYQEVSSEARIYGVRHYLYNTDNRALQFKQQIDSVATIGCINAAFKLNRGVPELFDTAQRYNLQIAMENTLPDVKAEVLSFYMNEQEKFELAVCFETVPFVLLDSIEDKLLLAVPNEKGDDDDEQTFFENTFFLKLTDDLYFKEYKLL